MPKFDQSIDLTVTIRYHGVKATAYFSKFTEESIKVVRGDIAALRMPQPKTTSFELVSHGCVEFGWDMMVAKNMIHKALIQKIDPSRPEDKQGLKEQLRELSITKISLRESPSFTGHTKPTVPQKRSSNHVKELLGEKPMSTSKVTRPGPPPFIKSEPAPQTIPTAPRPPAPLPSPPMSVVSTSQDDTGPHEDMRPAKRLKTEPKEPILRFTPSPGPGQSQSSVQQPTPSLTQVQVPSPQSTPPGLVAPLSLPSTQGSNELRIRGAGRVSQASSAVSRVVQGQERTSPPSQITPSDPPEDQPMTNSPTATIPPNPPEDDPMTDPVSTNDVLDVVPEQERTFPVTTTLPNAQENEVPTNSASTNQTTPPIEPAAERTTTLAAPTIPIATSSSLATSSPLASTSLAAITGRPPNSSDLPKIQTLSRELWDIRRKLTAEGVRESAVLDKLKLLHASYVPEPMSASSDRTLQALKTRLRKVEKDLENERHLRMKTEATLQDIRRECKAPFVVPALLDAFISISNLTTQALHPKGS
ncbi:hypothetical protein K443DRAFT_683374 [Laccaria amethystina LaAM-08-1]|uniref:Uncharacterized protein n=1 Tax=Laccaria amethystina LaAM-08-1 TaxID=1095629 RepID=A0A0C9XB40_9AGAR|nr:hypothetical protein K443DRAFT_683374 [Laccaria amethystina LaAM-08-1]